ncbi:hypothetical protein ALI144C_52765 [Actinosynnema sp. ALI-1.44]|uniref:Mur ligase family protein n=1 Tax=Actinosynnema sp. ALI-1.44 TaxID=1933779 RepID=UPI00097CAD33|nr:Mur ligase family protein [Actinosynnema sp. ALI-1.44]ONI71195.1 hypothetical protein ALI144C_52765 [Actinosynnema sp. ALI-1.44]
MGEFDLIVRSPGVRPDLLPDNVATTSVIREFLQRCPAPVIGVTGTQGKGTTCTAITAILIAAGRTAHLGGNIGRPPLDFLAEVRTDHVVVLELSNLQLIDAEVAPSVAVVLAVTPDHLNWHVDLEEYYAAKTPSTSRHKSGNLVVFDAANPVATRIAATSPGRKLALGDADGFHIRGRAIHLGPTEIVGAADVQLRGEHNLRNLTAAVAAVYDLVDGYTETIRAGVRVVRPLPRPAQRRLLQQRVGLVGI